MLNFLLFIFFLLVLSSFVSASSLFFCDTSENATFLMDINNQSNANDFDWTTYAYSTTDWTGGEDSITETFILKYPDTALNVNWTNQWEKVSKDTYDWYVWNYTKNDWQNLQHWDEFQMTGVIYNSSFNLSWTDHIQNNIIRVKVGLWSTSSPPYSAYSQARSYESAINYFTTVNFPSTPTVFFPKRGIYYDNISYINFTSTDVESSSLTYKIYINGTLNITTTTNVTKWNASNGYYRMDISASDGTYTGYNYTTYFGIALDTTPPTFSLNSTNVSLTTYNGTTVQINLTITDSTAVDFYIFTHNDTTDGSWLNDTLIDAGGVYSITMVWNRTIGNFSASGGTFGWKVWANDTLNNIAYSDTYTFIVQPTDTIPPSFSNPQTNASSTTYNGTTVQINLTITDTAVDFYIFTHNDTTDGSWLNDTLIDAGGVSSITMVWNRTISNFSDSGGTFGWKVWANDTLNNIAYSDTYTFIVQNKDFTPLSACGDLDIANQEYQLQNNVSSTGNCFNVTANNITLDCKGYEVNYSSDGGDDEYGIYSTYNFTTIKNCIIKEGRVSGNDDYAIYFNNAKNGTIKNNTITTSGEIVWGGIRLSSLGICCQYNTISNNTITTSGWYGVGIYDDNSDFDVISNNNITTSGSSGYGIFLLGSTYTNLSDNTINTSNTVSIYLFSTQFNTLSSNTITSFKGIILDSESKYNTLSNNTITTSGSNGYGIWLYSSPTNTISNNTITTSGNSGIGILSDSSSYNNLSDNTITTNGNYSDGINLDTSSNSNILNNVIATSGLSSRGIDLDTSSNNNLTNNIITTFNKWGIGIYAYAYSNSNTISDNNITTLGNHSEGIDLSQSSNSNINLNIITTSGNHSNGIYLHSSSNSNSLSNNTIVTSGTDSRGIDLATNPNSNIISNNTITTSGHYGYGVILAVNSNSNTISNNAITTSEYNSHGIFLSSNSNSNTLSNNTITTSDTYSYGIWLSLSSNSNLSNNTITTYNTHSYGILLYDLSNSNTLSNNAITTSGTSGYGIHLRLSSNNNIFSQMNVKTNGTAGYAIYLYDTNHNFTIRDSILNSSYAGVQELYVTSEVTGGNWNFTNVTRSNGNRINITWGGSANGTLNMKWWLDINTTYGGGALQDANVNIFDKNNVLQFSELTDSNGKLKKALIEYTQYNNTNITYLSFYNVIINKSGYTSYSNSSVNMTTNLFINTALNFIPTTPILISPADTQALATNYAVLTYNSTDADNATDTLTFYVYNSTDNSYFSLLFSGSGWVNTTYNWSNLADDDYYWKVKAGDGKNNSSNSTSYKFTISSTTPAITLNYPTPNKYFNTRNISYFNFTAVDPDGLSMCILYHNLGDSWLINQTTTTASSNVMFSFNQTDLLTDEHNYIWNVWCNDTANNGGFASSNFTFHVDSAYPIMNITKITTTAGSQTISFDVDYTDYSISSCKYSIYDSDGDIDGLYNNISVTCESTGNPATVSGYATYTLRLYGKDTAGNENSTNLSFTTSQISITSPPSGGGGGTVITECAKDADCSKYGEKYKCIQGKCIYQEFEEVCNYNNVCEPERGENFRNCGDELVNNTEMVKGDCHPLNLADLGKLAKSSQLFVWIVLILIVLGSTYFYQTRPKSFYQRKLKPYFAKKRRKA